MPEEVIIDGIRYVPQATTPAPRIGIAITTRDRREVYEATLKRWQALLPEDALLVVVDDASAIPAPGATVRFDTQQGIARAKNAGLAALMDAGCEHLFLADDDCYPIAEWWAELYINNPEPHLAYLFKDPSPRGRAPIDSPATVYDDGVTYALGAARGCFLYVHRSVVEAVGGMRPDFGVWGHEHVEYSLRIYHAGYTVAPYCDAVGSSACIYSMDEHFTEHKDFKRAVPQSERTAAMERNGKLLEKYTGTTDYVEYRDLPNLAITTLFTANTDPQRGRRMQANPALVGKWLASLQNCTPVVLVDELVDTDPTYVTVKPGMTNPYLARWVAVWHYLREHPARWVWVTDGTDVEMLHEPWSLMTPGTLIVGHEPTVVGIPWLREHHQPYAEWIDANAHRQLVNAGLVGGDHATVMAFIHDVIAEVYARGASTVDSDMAAFNYVVHTRWSDRVIWGPAWATVFKANERNAWSCWRHK